jgi:hypothetical protein
MPCRHTQTAPKTHETMKNVSFEMTVPGWQVYTPTVPADAIWDDGEWISWDYINQHIDDGSDDSCDDDFLPDDSVKDIFYDLVGAAKRYYQTTGRYLSIWGELGEVYAQFQYGIKRHRPYTQGSDGRVMNDMIEIKTISPEKTNDEVRVKRAGNFNMLLVVKIDENFDFESKMIDRKYLPKGDGKYASVKWSDWDTSGRPA